MVINCATQRTQAIRILGAQLFLSSRKSKPITHLLGELSLEVGDLGSNVGLALLVGELRLLVLLRLSRPVLGLLSRVEVRVLADLLEGVLVNFLNVLAANVVLEVRGKVLLKALVILLLKRLHELGNMATENVVAKDLGVEFLRLRVVARETTLIVRNENTAIRGTLHSTKHARTSRGALKTHVKVALERARLVITERLRVNKLLSLIHI